jgi:hypothetical protein
MKIAPIKHGHDCLDTPRHMQKPCCVQIMEISLDQHFPNILLCPPEINVRALGYVIMGPYYSPQNGAVEICVPCTLI